MIAKISKITLAIMLLLMSNIAFAHSGKTNSEGCHMNSSIGEYHCHNNDKEDEAKINSKTEARTEARGVYDCSSNTYNCSDFSRHEDAQNAYGYCMESAGKDVHDLDRDNDGIACEDLI